MSNYNIDTAKHMINRAAKGEDTLRQYQHKTGLYIAHLALESSDYNLVATFLTKLGHKMPSKGEQLSEWFAAYFPMQIHGKDNTYTCCARRKQGDIYNYHHQPEAWQFDAADAAPYWHARKKPASAKDAEGLEKLRETLTKFGSDKRINSERVTVEAAKLANTMADSITTLMQRQAMAAADKDATIKAQAARIDKLEAMEEELERLKAQQAAKDGKQVKAA